MDEPRFDPLDYLSAFNRRKWWFIVPVVLSVVAGALLVMLLPRAYQTTATIAVSSSRLAPSLGNSGQLGRQERLRAVSQQLLSRPVIERTAMLERLDQDRPIDSIVERVRSSVQIAMPDSITPGGRSQLSQEARAELETYQVSYVDDSAENAQRVLNRLAEVFVDENNKSREMRAQDTSEFITGQLRSSEERLGGLEARVREMKESYMGRLPEQTNANLQMVANLQRTLESNATTLRGEQDRLTMVERQIEGLQQGADAPVVSGSADSPQARVLTLRSELAGAQLSYTDRHPEVVRLKEELATAERAAAAERTRPATDRQVSLNASPEYRQLVKDREMARFRIAEIQRSQAATMSAIGQYQSRIEQAPRVEQQLISVQREYDLERNAYGDLTLKRQAALLNEDLQRKQGGEQFAVLVPASLPTEPFKPKPIRVMLMALAAGLVLGGAGVVGREYLDRSVHDARGLRDEFELPVLAEIPRIEVA